MPRGLTLVRLLPQRFDRHDAFILVGLCAAAYAGNVAAVPLFAGADLLLGGVAVMLTAIRRSLAETAVVAAVGSLHTIVLWGHPYAWIILVLEAICVHVLYKRRGGEITLWDALFWGAAGVPLVLAFYGLALRIDWVAVSLIALKQPINGLLYAALASLIHHALVLRKAGSSHGHCEVHLTDQLAPVLVTFALIPTLLVVALYAQFTRREMLSTIETELGWAAQELDASKLQAGFDNAGRGWRDDLTLLGAKDPALALVDDNGTVVVEKPSGWYSRRSQVTRLQGQLVKREDESIAATMAREEDAYYARRISDPQALQDSGWELVVSVSAAPYVERLRTLELAGLALVAVIGLGAIIGGRFLARRTAGLLDPILARLERVPKNLDRDNRDPWPQPSVTEFKRVTDGLAELEGRLSDQMQALTESERRLRTIATNLPGGVDQRIMTPDGEVRFGYLSPNYQSIFGIDIEQARHDAQEILARIHPQDRAVYDAALLRSTRTMETLDVAFRYHHPDGGTQWVRSLGQPHSAPDGSVIWDGISLDETAQKEAEHRLEHLVRYDSLTGLFNREEFGRQLGHFVDLPSGAAIAVLFVDLDNLKWINDTLGHAAGDEAIREAARRIQAALRDADCLARYGGDEFVVLAVGAHDEAAAATIARRIIDHLGAPFFLQGRPVELSATIGIAVQAEQLDSVEECLRRADLALYQGKEAGRSRWCFYSEAIDEQHRQWVDLLGDLRGALDSEALSVHYQPKIDLVSGRMTGVEALARWHHTQEGWIPPDWFISLAERGGLIDTLSDQILRRACADLVAWQAQYPQWAPQHVAVNISGQQLASDHLFDSVSSALHENGLEPSSLELEITEQVFYSGATGVLERLRDMGIWLSIDDYGTGYSSMLVLRDSPAEVLKLDRSFVNRMEMNEPDRLIVEHAIELAHALNRTVIAEGIETNGELVMLRRMGCDTGQGYFFARPMAADQIPRLWHEYW